ncbi:MAG TPA: sulfatase-like hydrolase/transferase [Vicinamibacterales bacterium]|nr:sulfatase-like hydrolase/transferase [Vicinamibacterales bacterium]
MTGRSDDARPSPPPAPAGPRRRFNRRFGVAALVLVAAVALAAAWWTMGQRPASTAGGVELGRLAGGHAPADLNLVVITLDTTRADRLGAYGYAAGETPVIDRLAREGVLFEQAMTDAPLTLPAHCSIFTARHPPRHGVRDNGGFFLSPQQRTLASELRHRGLRTGAVVGAFVLDGKWGLGQGFEYYGDEFEVDRVGGFGVGEIQRRGAEVVDKALPWLEQVKGERFFAWLHFYDPHTPYDAPEPYGSRFAGHPYDAEIAYTDAQVGRLVEFLERHDLLERTVVVVVGDHGEGLNQHSEGTHGFFIYESTTRVPFIVRAPFERTRGRRVADPVRTVDVMPTVLDLMGIAAPADIDGTSLAPLMTGDRATLDLEGYAEALYPLHHYGWSDLRAWRAGRYKVIDAPRPELYDLERDPHESTNLYAERQALADGMIRRLRQQQPEIDADETVARPTPEVDPEARARLAALGYVGSFVATVAGPRSDRADPKDKIELFNLMSDAREIAREEKAFDRVAAIYRQVLDEDPTVVDAWFNLGNVAFRQKKYEDAIAHFKRTLALKPDYDLPVINMANAYRHLGQDEAALAGYEHYLTIDPKNANVRYQMGEIYLERGDAARAEQSFRQALAIDPREASARTALGAIAFQRGDLATAERETRAALETRPGVRLAHYNLALIAEERGDWPTAIAEYRKEIEAHPNAFKAAFNLGLLHERLGQPAEQVAALQQSVDMNPRFAEGRIFLAKAFLEAGTRFPEAIALAREGLELAPRQDVAQLGHFVLADLYNRVGRPAEAAREAERGRRIR